MWKMLPFKNKE